ncbi:MAG TPA: hypothetical protein VGI16_10100, partial [Candidatus Acidoferrum sp.]
GDSSPHHLPNSNSRLPTSRPSRPTHVAAGLQPGHLFRSFVFCLVWSFVFSCSGPRFERGDLESDWPFID